MACPWACAGHLCPSYAVPTLLPLRLQEDWPLFLSPQLWPHSGLPHQLLRTKVVRHLLPHALGAGCSAAAVWGSMCVGLYVCMCMPVCARVCAHVHVRVLVRVQVCVCVCV